MFIEHLLPGLPTRTEEEIHAHEEWYQEYLFLNETKKEAIKRWREKREVYSFLLTKIQSLFVFFTYFPGTKFIDKVSFLVLLARTWLRFWLVTLKLVILRFSIQDLQFS